MATNLRELMKDKLNREFATDAGRTTHVKLQRVFIDGATVSGDANIIAQIKTHPELVPFFAPCSLVEVPIVAYISGRLVSRRIDRMIIDEAHKTVRILDYKTDIAPNTFYDKYVAQVREYMQILRMIYPGFSVRGFILWTHNWHMEEIS